jgi:DNA replication protein DnaC
LGAEFSTVVTSAALFDIINQRLLLKKHTVISTNLSLMELDDQYSDRIVSRLWGYFKVLKFFGDDIRVKKKYRGAV